MKIRTFGIMHQKNYWHYKPSSVMLKRYMDFRCDALKTLRERDGPGMLQIIRTVVSAAFLYHNNR